MIQHDVFLFLVSMPPFLDFVLMLGSCSGSTHCCIIPIGTYDIGGLSEVIGLLDVGDGGCVTSSGPAKILTEAGFLASFSSPKSTVTLSIFCSVLSLLVSISESLRGRTALSICVF